MIYPTTHTSLSPIRRGVAPCFVNYKKGCTRLTATSDKVYQLLAHGRWFSPGIPASSTTKTGRHDIAEILLKVALSTKKSINQLKPFQASTLTYFSTCPFGQLTKKSTCPTQSFSCPKKLIKITNTRESLSRAPTTFN